MGTVARIPVFQGLSFEEIRDFLNEQDVKTYLADMGDAICYHDLPTKGRVAVVFGNEGSGLDEDWRGLQQPRIAIPMENGVESLNVAMAAGIIAYDRYIRSRKT
jgi:tRNA G18 (ribose-2'-O)-methylase SpoU